MFLQHKRSKTLTDICESINSRSLSVRDDALAVFLARTRPSAFRSNFTADANTLCFMLFPLIFLTFNRAIEASLAATALHYLSLKHFTTH